MRAFGADERGGVPLRLEQTKIYPAPVRGTFRRLKWGLLVATLLIYYGVPFLRWDRGGGRPNQAVLFDFANQRFHIFGIEIWPQEVYFITGVLVLASLGMFLATALVGRAWCGYFCPQTIWTDLFRVVEQFFQGERRDQVRRDQGPWTFERLWRKAATHLVWLLIGLGTGGAFTFYFTDAPELVRSFLDGTPSTVALSWIGILTTTTYLLAGFSREQVCLYMCPWPRIQAALTDEWALNIAYSWDRGEPRGSLKATEKARSSGEKAGDCVDCGRCLAVCPAGVDIRFGLQMGCIQCGLCIDACDEVMTRVGRETRLITYQTDAAIEARLRGEVPVRRLVRPRTVIYAVLIVIVASVMSWRLMTRPMERLFVMHDRNPIAVLNSDGSVRNAYTLRISNMMPLERSFALTLKPLPVGARIEADGTVQDADGALVVKVPADANREIRLRLTLPTGRIPVTNTPVFIAAATDGAEALVVEDYFAAPPP